MFELSKIPTRVIQALTAIVALALIVAGGYFFVANKDQKIEKLTEKNAQQGAVIEIQKDALVLDDKSDKANEVTNVQVQAKTQTLRTKHDKIKAQTQEKVEQIKEEYQGIPLKTSTAKELADRLSAARIDGLWESYCDKLPQAQGCEAIHKPKTKGAQDGQVQVGT